MTEEVIVKKEKNPKRVEQGKKLAEWNKKNKKAVLEAQPAQEEEVPAQEVSSQEKPAQEVIAQEKPKLNSLDWILGGGALVIIGALYFINHETKQVQQIPQKAQEKVPQEAPKKKYYLIHHKMILLLWIKKKYFIIYNGS